jgi:hypothetical protein
MSARPQPIARGRVIAVNTSHGNTRIEVEIEIREEDKGNRIQFEDWVEVRTIGRLTYETFGDPEDATS